MSNKFLKKLIVFDAFPKVEAGYQSSSAQGGLITIIVSVLLGILIISEFKEYWSMNHKYEFLVDSNINHKIQLNVDITINTPCQYLLINVIDVAGEILHMTNELKLMGTTFEVGSAHRIGEKNEHQSEMDVKGLLRDASKKGDPLSIYILPGSNSNACRIFGDLEVNKVAGNLHISDINSIRGSSISDTKNFLNFSHRIDEFSFGTHYPLLVNPLDNSVEISRENYEAFQYFLSIVPTTYIDNNNRILYTNQYSVTDYNKIVDQLGLTSIPGIFFKYDIEPISVRITENSKIGFIGFLTRLSGLVGGIWATAAFSYKIINYFLSLFTQNDYSNIVNLSNNKIIQLDKIN